MAGVAAACARRVDPMVGEPARLGPAGGRAGRVGPGRVRAQVVEGSGVEVVDAVHGACYLFDPERRRATAVLALKVEWTLSTDASKSSRAAALNDLTARLADTPGVVELKETALLLPGAAPAPDLPDDGGSPDGCAATWRNCGPCRRS